MNAITLYLSTCKLVMNINKDDPNSWTDLYRLVPYLRQSLSCSVCSNLALEPQTPARGNCQHHVCRKCQNGRKKLKPSCQCCRVYTEYKENWQLRSIQRCYKQLCIYFKTTPTYKNIFDLALNANDTAAANLMELILEASTFPDNYKSNAGLSQCDYSILPYVYVSGSSTNHHHVSQSRNGQCNVDISPVQLSPSSPLQSLSHPSTVVDDMNTLFSNRTKDSNGTGASAVVTSIPISQSSNLLNNRTVTDDISHSCVVNSTGNVTTTSSANMAASTPVCTASSVNSFKKPTTNRSGLNSNRSQVQAGRRKGCRCGNATPTPGKLTCCGQRCPCYVDGKACLECRCRGCRNPHRADGVKVRPHIPATQNLHIHYPETPKLQVDIESETISLNTISFSTPNLKVVGLYSGDLNQISSTVPSAILMGDETSDMLTEVTDNSDIDLDL